MVVHTETRNNTGDSEKSLPSFEESLKYRLEPLGN